MSTRSCGCYIHQEEQTAINKHAVRILSKWFLMLSLITTLTIAALTLGNHYLNQFITLLLTIMRGG